MLRLTGMRRMMFQLSGFYNNELVPKHFKTVAYL